MSHKVWLIADPHFGHQGMCEFLREDGTKVRPFSTAAEMDGELVLNWNMRVSRTDKVYVLGDVTMSHHGLQTLGKCLGDKILIKGNHDQEKLSKYAAYFRDVRACWQLGGCLLSHIPIHPDSLSRWKANIHGHLHHRRVMRDGIADPRYLCVSVEHTNYAPILLEDALARIHDQQAQ